MTAPANPPGSAETLGARRSLTEKVEAARTTAAGHGYAITFTGPAAAAYVRGCVDGFAGRPNTAEAHPMADNQEAYDYAWHAYRRRPRDRHGCTYDCALF